MFISAQFMPMSWSERRSYGYQILLYLSNMLSTTGVKELRFYTWLTPSSIYFNCDKSCSIDSDELVNHQNRSDICWKYYPVFPVHRQRQYSLTIGQWGIPCPYMSRWEFPCPNKEWMITKWLLRVTATKQRANGLNPLVYSFPSLSVTSQT